MCEKRRFQSTKSGAGEQFLLQDFRARADMKGLFLFTDTNISTAFGQPLAVAPLSSPSWEESRILLALGRGYRYIYIYIYIYNV